MIAAVVPCGKSKQAERSRADALYTGTYHNVMLRTARRHYLDDQIVILSAKYGILALDRMIDPYDITFGDPEAIDPRAVKIQAARFEWADPVVILGGNRYAQIVRQWAAAVQPFSGGIGDQMSQANRWAPCSQ